MLLVGSNCASFCNVCFTGVSDCEPEVRTAGHSSSSSSGHKRPSAPSSKHESAPSAATRGAAHRSSAAAATKCNRSGPESPTDCPNSPALSVISSPAEEHKSTKDTLSATSSAKNKTAHSRNKKPRSQSRSPANISKTDTTQAPSPKLSQTNTKSRSNAACFQGELPNVESKSPSETTVEQACDETSGISLQQSAVPKAASTSEPKDSHNADHALAKDAPSSPKLVKKSPERTSKKRSRVGRSSLLPASLKAKSELRQQQQQQGDCEEETMHYKKIHLLDFGAKKESASGGGSGSGSSNGGSGRQPDPAPHHKDSGKESLSASGINLNQSLTDQIAKLSKTDAGQQQQQQSKRNWEDMAAATSLASMSGGYHPSECGGAGAGPSPPRDGPGPGPSPDRPTSSNSTTTITTEHNNNKESDTSVWRSSSAQGAPPPPAHNNSRHSPENNRASASSATSSKSASSSSNSRAEDSRAPSRNPAGSPLLLDKSRTIEPYRDPELLKKDQEMRRIQSMQAAITQQTGRPSSVHSLTPAPTSTTVPPIDSTHVGTLASHQAAVTALAATATHPLLAAIPAAAAYAHPLSAHVQLHPQLAAAAASLDRSSLGLLQQQQAAAHLQQLQLLQQQQQSQQQQQQQQTLLSSYSLHNPNPLQTRQLELLWQQKYPNIQVPPAWMLHQYQDELLRDVSLINQRSTPADLAALERERRERERELAIERERAERERAEREQQREREQRERERAERERAERERQERERREREER